MIVIDTNVLIYASVPETDLHVRSLAAIEAARRQDGVAVTRQCLREFLATASRPQSWANRPDMARAVASVQLIASSMTVLDDGAESWRHLLELAKHFRFGSKQVHDANIVATMLAHGQSRLLTFNGADFRRFAPLIEVVEPDA